MSERNDGAPAENELEARWLTREEMTELMRKIRAKVAAGEAERILNTPPRPPAAGIVFGVDEEERRDELREQARKLKGESE